MTTVSPTTTHYYAFTPNTCWVPAGATWVDLKTDGQYVTVYDSGKAPIIEDMTIEQARGLAAALLNLTARATPVEDIAGVRAVWDVVAGPLGTTVDEVAADLGIDLANASTHDAGRISVELGTRLAGARS